MAYASKKIYYGDDSTTQFAVTMPFISPAHIDVYVNEVLQLDPLNYVLSGTTVTFSHAPAQDDAIWIRRNTSPNSLLVDFHDGSVLNEADLDMQYQHNFYLYQEAVDSYNELINNAMLAVATGVGIVETETDEIIDALVAEMLNHDSASTLQQRVADIDNNAEAIIDLGTGLQVQINTLASGVAAAVYIQPTEPVPGVGGIPDPITDGARWYDSDDNNRAYIYLLATLEWVDITDPRIGQAAADILVLQTDVDDNAAAVVTEASARSTADSATASLIALIGAENGAQTAFIVDSTTVKIDSDGGDTFATRFSALATADSDNSAAITSEESARITADGVFTDSFTLMGAENVAGTAFILNENTVKIDSDLGDTLAQRFTALSAATATAEANIVIEHDAWIAADIVLAGVTTTLQSQVNSEAGQLDTAQVTIAANTSAAAGAQGDADTLMAKYGVTLNVNGYITGWATNNDGETGTFVILADKFAVVDPSGDPGETEYSPFEIDNGQINMTGAVKINGSLMVNGTLVGAALVAGTIGTTQIGANAITTDQLNAQAVTAAKIETNTITSTQIFGTQLDVLAANTGTLTVDEYLQMGAAGYILGGQTAYNTGAGFYLGYDSGEGEYVFSIGDGANQSLTWDGAVLTVKGDLLVGSYVQSDEIILSATTERLAPGGPLPSYQTKKTFTVDKPGSVRVTFDWKHGVYSGSGHLASYWRVTVNSVDKSEWGSTSQTSYTTATVNLTGLEAGDVIDIDAKGGEMDQGGEPMPVSAYVKNAYVKADVIISSGGTVDLD